MTCPHPIADLTYDPMADLEGADYEACSRCGTRFDRAEGVTQGTHFGGSGDSA